MKTLKAEELTILTDKEAKEFGKEIDEYNKKLEKKSRVKYICDLLGLNYDMVK